MTDILIVEDGRQEQLRLLKLATESGFTAEAVSDVDCAIQSINTNRYRLVILDLGLEGKSGLHLFRLIKELPHRPLVVVLTGNPSSHLKQRFIDEGAAAYLYKGSEAASNDSIAEILRSLLSVPAVEEPATFRQLPLAEFLRDFVTPASREFFQPNGGDVPACISCGSTTYIVEFSHRTQLPPRIEGRVCCAKCSALLDPELG